MICIRVEALTGEDIWDAYTQAGALAQRLGIRVVFHFNKSTCTADHNGTGAQIGDNGLKLAEWKAFPRGWRAKEKDARVFEDKRQWMRRHLRLSMRQR